MSSNRSRSTRITADATDTAAAAGDSATTSPINSHRQSTSPHTPVTATATSDLGDSSAASGATSPSGLHPTGDVAARERQLEARAADLARREEAARQATLALDQRLRDLEARESAARLASLESQLRLLQRPTPTRDTSIVDARFGDSDGQCPKFDGTPRELAKWVVP